MRGLFAPGKIQKQMKKLTKETKKILQFKWGLRLKLRAEGDNLRAEGDKLWAESNKLRAEGDNLRAESNRLRAEANKLWAKGYKLQVMADKFWLETVLEFCGNIKLEWKWIPEKQDSSCELEDGTVFNP
jgi:uncharacterized coiled-coil DUF342 family protein